MADRIGKRVVVWLPETLINRIDEERDWRTTSDYIRNALLGLLCSDRPAEPRPVAEPVTQKAPAKAKARTEPEPEPPSIIDATEAECKILYRETYGDDQQWALQVSANEGVEAAIAAVMREPVFVGKLTALRANKNPGG